MGVLIIGFISGIFSGLGVGGGTILVPALILLLGVEQHVAQGVSLAAFIPTSIVAVITHWRQGNVRWSLVLTLAVGSITGALLGATLAEDLTPQMLRKVFGVFLVLMGTYELLAHNLKAPVFAPQPAAHPLPPGKNTEKQKENSQEPEHS